MNTVGILIVCLFILYGVVAAVAPAWTYYKSVSTVLRAMRLLRIQRSPSYPAYEAMAALYREGRARFAEKYQREISQMRVSGIGLAVFSCAVLWFFYF